jgi:serine/threonine protein kinase
MTKNAQEGFRIRFVRPIGAGGFGSVDEVVVVSSSGSPPVGTRLARKQLGPQWAKDPQARERFEREIEMLAQMHHPNIVSLEGVSLSEVERCYVMPLYASSLRDLITQAPNARTPIEVARFGVPLAEALQYAHDMTFRHRDLKPENILLDGERIAVIADWGVGKFVHKTSKVLDLTRGGIGTAYYCSSQQWANGDDPTGDIYSLGVVLAEVARGSQLPIDPIGSGIRVDVVSTSLPGGSTFNAIIRRMTAAVPSMRYTSMADVARELRRVG